MHARTKVENTVPHATLNWRKHKNNKRNAHAHLSEMQQFTFSYTNNNALISSVQVESRGMRKNCISSGTFLWPTVYF